METDESTVKFPFATETVTLIYYSDLEKFAQTVYGKTPDFTGWLEANQDTVHNLEISKNPRSIDTIWDNNLSDEDYLLRAEEAIQQWINAPSKFSWENSTPVDPTLIAWDLARKGLIPEGKFKLHVWW